MTPDTSTVAGALVALASVSAVVWTGGLIVLQLRRAGQNFDRQQHDLTNAGMACAAYAFLVPLLGLLATSTLVRDIAIGATTLYLIMTIGNVKSIIQGLAWNNNATVYIAAGYLLPTIMLALLIAIPNENFILWSSASLLFVSYFILSFMARMVP